MYVVIIYLFIFKCSFVIFNKYRLPRTALLNKYGDVLEDGTYKTPLRNSKARTGKSLGALSTGRINITTACAINLNSCITIAIRYAAVRKQFSDVKSTEEIPIIEYQSLVKGYLTQRLKSDLFYCSNIVFCRI